MASRRNVESRDNTKVISMLRDFSDIMFSKASDSSTESERIAHRLDFDADTSSFIDTRSFHDAGISVLQNQVVSLQAELFKCQATIKKLESERSSDEPRRKKAMLEKDREVEQLREQLQREKEKTGDLKLQLVHTLEKEAEVKSTLKQSWQQTVAEKLQLEEKLKTVQKQCHQYKIELDELSVNSNISIKKLDSENKKLVNDLKNVRTLLDQAEEKAQLFEKQSLEQKCKLSKAWTQLSEMKLSAVQLKELEEKFEKQKETFHLAEIMDQQLKKLPDLEKEVKQLREENKLYRQTRSNVQLLKEQLHTAQIQVEKYSQLRKENTELKMEVQLFKKRLSEWEEVDAGEETKTRSPSSVLQRIARLQKSELLLADQVSKLSAENNSLKLIKENNSSEIAKMNTELQRLKVLYEDQTALLRRVQKRLLLVSKERDTYKNVLDSYENEVTVNASLVATKRIQSLENIVSDYRHNLESMEKDLSQLRSQRQELLIGRTFALIDSEVQTDPVSIEDSNQDPDVQIIHFRSNPLEMASRQRLGQLKKFEEENERLKARIKVLEECGGSAEDITAKVQVKMQEMESMDPKRLKEQLTSAEAKNKRLLEAFRKTSQEFREVCYVLTGYRIDIPSHKKYKVSHMYADSPNDFLMFEHSSEGQMNLLATDYSLKLTEMVDMYLKGYDSIPAFLSALTLDLFKHQTCFLMQTSTFCG